MSGTYGWLGPAGEEVTGGLTAVGEPKGVVLMVAVEDVEGTLQRAERLGGKCLGPSERLELEGEKGEPDAFLMSSFQDPEGNTVAVIERSKPA